ncbi:MAG: neuraminidase-like domain-containing protein [Pseudomonadota bacterium]
MERLNISAGKISTRNIGDLHKALTRLNLKVEDDEINCRRMGETTVGAIKDIQKRNKLPANGKLDLKTIEALNAELFDSHHTQNKMRIKKLRMVLEKVGIKIPEEERKLPVMGEQTRKAIKEFQKKYRFKADGRLNDKVFEKLQDVAVVKTFSTKNQKGILQKKLLKVNAVANLKLKIAPKEIKEKELGTSTKKVIKAFQDKYSLPATGELNKATIDKINSVAASKGKYQKKLKPVPANKIEPITKTLRLNMVSPQVSKMQKALSYMGYTISQKEFNTQTFGKTTIKAVKQFQKENDLAQTGHFDMATKKMVNDLVVAANPGSKLTHRYRIRGSVRDLLWQRKPNMVIKVFEKGTEKESAEPLGAKKIFLNGFFDIPYDAPIDPATGQTKEKFHLVVRLFTQEDQKKHVAQQIHYNANPIHWVNFVESQNEKGKIEYNGKYAGKSDYEITGRFLKKALGDTKIDDLKETRNDKQISQLALQTGLGTDDIMCHILSRLVARSVDGDKGLNAEVFYLFIRQNLPADLPGDLLRGTSEWETIDHLVERAASGIMFLDDSTQKTAIDNAVSRNLVSRAVKINKNSIIQSLTDQRTHFALTKPILIGNGSLKDLLDKSSVSFSQYNQVASIFIKHRGVNPSFWEEIQTYEAQIGAKAIADFTTAVEVGNISKNHLPTVQFLKDNIGTGQGKKFKAASDIAKLDQEGLKDLINENSQQVPDNMPGDTQEARVDNFAAAMKTRSELLYPAVSFVAQVKRDSKKIVNINEIQAFIDDNKTFSFRQQNLDKYLLDHPDIQIDDEVKEELKIIQRVHKLTNTPPAGAALIDEGLHSSMQIYFLGKEQLAAVMEKRHIDKYLSDQLYETSKLKYIQILGRLTEFRQELNKDIPAAINAHTYTTEEIQQAVGDIPDLEVLFGSLDYCDCKHCKSLYSPSAYLTDMLRFLNEHSAKDTTKTVKDILFERRPDIGNIKLNCTNTDTPLPYIDLVCEILENNLAGNNNFVYQTTLSSEELRAIPQYIQPLAYQTLAGSDYPMNGAFNLWQEESRSYLEYLRVPRFELMEAFQDTSDPNNKKPSDVNIAAEYFGLSAKEKDLIITQKQTATDQNKYWGTDTTKTKMTVSLFMKRSKLDYNEMLELLMVKFVNEPGGLASQVERPVDSCDTGVQSINNLTIEKYDLMHRFLRLWRKTGWKMWELDLLIRNPKIGDVKINGTTLIQLKRFRQLQEKLNLSFETLLAFFQEINREVRITPEQPDVMIEPLYNKFFQNIAVTNPVDDYFKALDSSCQPISLDANVVFGINSGAPYNGYTPVPTILSALALTQKDFDLLNAKTDNHLSVASLSILMRYRYLARSLKLGIKECLLFLDIINESDPFSSVKTTFDIIKQLEQIKSSGMSLLELDYILKNNSESSVGLRNESIKQFIALLRKILATNKDKVDQLNLSEADRNHIAGFDTDALAAMTDPQLIAVLTPLNAILKSAVQDFKEASFSVEETNFIINYDTTSITSAGKTILSEQIKILQKNLNNLLTRNANQIKSHIATSFMLTDEQATIILENIIVSPGPVPIIKILENENLIARQSDGTYYEINSTYFSDHFDAYALLHKVSILVLKMQMETKDLKWFILNDASVNTLNFSGLTGYEQWYNLCLFLEFKSKFPEPENASLRGILDLAKDSTSTIDAIFTQIADLTQWDKTQISSIHAGFQLQHTAGNPDYTDAGLFPRLVKCFDQMKLTGVDAVTMFSWAEITNDLTANEIVAKQTRQAVKSKYEQSDWLEKITPIHNDIREKKRTALVEYLLEHSQRNETKTISVSGKTIPNPLYWKDSNALFKYFLIDVEMTSCQLTSRIKQALSSIQLFVQRCFLNLENRYVEVTQDQKADKTSPNAWSQWKWMKNYRIWEANRKIFFYPENWLEPELRDNKSPFFEELENELMQDEATKENVETAFLNFLHKVDEVSNLEVCGLYHEMENLNPHAVGYETNIVHVIGRTRSIPVLYYYRTYDMNYNIWNSWEKIDVDITGDQVVPVVYNRKLHLFWLQFMQKPMKTKKVPATEPTEGPQDAPEPRKFFEIQLGWSIKKASGWTPKKVSKQKLIHPWERPEHSYNLKPYYLAKFNELYMDIYLSTSKEFNDTRFYDPSKKAIFNPVYLTKNRFHETYLPWHSSSFVFNGDVKDIKLKGLGGHHSGGWWIFNWDYWSAYDSYDYVHENFGEDGAAIKELDPAHEYGPRLRLPTGMHFHNTHLTNNQKDAPNNKDLRVLEGVSTTTLLQGANSPFELVIDQQDLQFNTIKTGHPMFYQDSSRVFFIKPEWESRLDSYGHLISSTYKYRFMPFYHPYTLLFLRELNRDGIDGVLNRTIQRRPWNFEPENTFNFSEYSPTSDVIVGGKEDDAQKYRDIVDFSFSGANSIYNWELFFHAPLMVACRLMQNQKFEDAMNWFHYIFDPTNIENYPTPQRYWVTKPFFEYNSDDYRKQRIESILTNLNENMDKLSLWRNNPFKPHVIAQYRPVAYQKNVVMKYLDNLISWGDMLFKRDTIESINQASLLYMLAYEILGERPRKVPNVNHEEMTFNELETELDQFGNVRVDVIIEDTLLPVTVTPGSSSSEPVPKLEIMYFCIPNNEYLTQYWDTVEDRLFKIRHCMNIQGQVRQLPLFEPPIDPGLLVKAAASGMDLSSVLSDLTAPTPNYRFRIVLQKAIEFCNEVKALGDKLHNALSNKDAEALSLTRSEHEIKVMEAVKEVRKKQIDEAVEVIGGLNKAFDLAEEKRVYYDGIPRMNEWEISGAIAHGLGIASEIIATIANTLAAGLYLIPEFEAGAEGFGGTPTALVEFGGEQAGKSAAKVAALFQGLSTISHSAGSMLETQGSYTRRDKENEHQKDLAVIEKKQIQFQINAAKIRQTIAEKELENQEMLIENAETVDDYMRNKFTNKKLYSWMITQISTVYFQAYQLAFDMAKKAEKCFENELGITNSNIIQFGYWDSLKKGLLSGERLMGDLRRLEAEYINQNRREFEITKHVSLAQIAPLSLITLKETGKCSVSLPEWLFDMDYPGHYMRRIKNVSISVPCITGPFAGVNCTLSLLRNETRTVATLSAGSYEKQPDDTRFKTMYGEISSIATSHAQNDGGLFELNFNDERYLPFEGAGVISDWQIDMPIENNYFDFASISDVILHVSYTSRAGGSTLATPANTYLQTKLPSGTARLFSLKHEFATQWHTFLNPEGGADQELVIQLKQEHYPFFIRNKLNTIKIKKMNVFVESDIAQNFTANVKVTSQGYLEGLPVDKSSTYNNVHHMDKDFTPGSLPLTLGEVKMKLKVTGITDFKSLTADQVDDIFILFQLGV